MFDISSIGWQHTIPVMVLFLSAIFLKPISTKILQLRGFKRKEKELEFSFDAEKESIALPEPGTTVISHSDVLEEFKKIEWFTEADILTILDVIHRNLLQNGIVTRSQLAELVSSRRVLNSLSALYSKYLDREPNNPFDPVALSAYGPPLLLYKDKAEVIQRITIMLLFSEEYKEKSKKRRMTMGSITGEARIDYFHILCTECGKHVDCTYKGFDPAIPYLEYK